MEQWELFINFNEDYLDFYNEIEKYIRNKGIKDVFRRFINDDEEKRMTVKYSIANHQKHSPFIFRNGKFIGEYKDMIYMLQHVFKKYDNTDNINLLLPIGKEVGEGEGGKEGLPFNYQASSIEGMNGIKYLIKKHDNVCVYFHEDHHDLRDDLYHEDLENPIVLLDIAIIYIISDNKLKLTEEFYKNYWKCINNDEKRFIAVLLVIKEASTDTTGHANLLLYDRTLKTMERFEPHGSMVYYSDISKEIDKNIISTFATLFPNLEIKEYYEPIQFCPNILYQRYQEYEFDLNGFCMMWSLWYADLRISNPNVSVTDVIDISLKMLFQRNENLTDFIKKYITEITKG